MKNEYFGDVRDLFKYDLAFELLHGIRSLQRFTFVPMLTPNEGNGDGRRTNYNRARAGRGNERLVKFLRECVNQGRRDIYELERFFYSDADNGTAQLVIHKKDDYFRHTNRTAYFDSLPRQNLLKAVILVDPDNGLEVKSSSGREEKYLRFEEACSLWKRMGAGSVLVLFQFIPRVPRRSYFCRIADRLKKAVRPVYYVSDNQVVFFVLPKGKTVSRRLNQVLSGYAQRNEIIVGQQR